MKTAQQIKTEKLEFAGTEQRDEFIDRNFPHRKSYSSTVPGFFKLGNGMFLGVFCDIVTLYANKRGKFPPYKITNPKLAALLKRATEHLEHGEPCRAVDTLNRALALNMDAETRRQVNKALDEAHIGNPATAETLLEMLLADLEPKHRLIIHSLHDAQLECSCHKWSLIRSGQMTRKEAQTAHAIHANL
jgi:hypothetical protein